jgi:hypothetical protein
MIKRSSKNEAWIALALIGVTRVIFYVLRLTQPGFEERIT